MADSDACQALSDKHPLPIVSTPIISIRNNKPKRAVIYQRFMTDLVSPTEPVRTPQASPPKHPRPPRRRSKLWWAFVCACIVLVAVCVLVYALLASSAGTRFVLDRIAGETGVRFTYDHGTLKDGVHIKDVVIANDPKLDITVDKAFVQIGWRALFARQVHLSAIDIGTLRITNHTAPSDEPFGYEAYRAPVNLWIQNASVQRIVYAQLTREPVNIEGVNLKALHWQDHELTVTDGNLKVTDIVTLKHIHGDITLNHLYPLKARATVVVDSLADIHVDPLDVQATGTLKRTVGTVISRYNKHKVTGDFVVQGMDKGTPFWARLAADEIVLPYASEQHITLSDATVIASGVASGDTDIDLRIHSHVDGRDIPQGLYHGRASVTVDGMDIHHLSAHTEGGLLTVDGKMDWHQDFVMSANIYGDGVLIAPLVPSKYADYAVYAPKHLTGALKFGMGLKDDADHAWYDFDLHQKDGERVHARLTQANYHANAPWLIAADWSRLVRAELPNIGRLDSPHGKAQLSIHKDGMVKIKADANISELLGAPQGDYHVDAVIEDRSIALHDTRYKGELGALDVKGVIELAHGNKPLTWQLEARTPGLLPKKYFKDAPFDRLVGDVTARGTMRTTTKGQVHDISFGHLDVTASMDEQSVALRGQGKLGASLAGGTLTALSANFDGKLVTHGINEALVDNTVSLVAQGTPNKFDISKLTLAGSAGNVSAAGQLSFAHGIRWDVAGRVDRLDVGQLHPKSPMLLTGDIVTKGSYINGKLTGVYADYVGRIDRKSGVNADLPSGNLVLNANMNGDALIIDKLDFAGQAGKLQATGELNIGRGWVGWLDASMQALDIGHFVKDYKSHLTGKLSARIDWQKDNQSIGIDDMDITGTVNEDAFMAKGRLAMVLDLPDNLSAYLTELRRGTARRFDERRIATTDLSDSLNNLSEAIGEQARINKRLIKSVHADDMVVILGDNRLGLDGDGKELVLDINAQTLSQIVPTLRGAISGGLIIVQDGHPLPTFYSDLKVSGIGYGNFAIREGAMIGKFVNLGNEDSQLLLTGERVLVAGRSFNRLHFDFNGTQAKHLASVLLSSDEMQIQAKLDGSLSDQGYHGVVSEGRLQTAAGVLNQRQPTEINYHFADQHLQVAAHCWQTLTNKDAHTGAVCLPQRLSIKTEKDREAGDVNVVLQNLDTSVFSPILPSDLSWHARLHGKVEARWGRGVTPVVNAVLYSDNGTIGLRAKDTPDVLLPYQRVSLIAQTVPTGLKLRTDINAGRGGQGYADIIINPYQQNKPIAGALVLNELKLDVLRPFFPAIQTMSGSVNVAGGLGGTLKKPLFYGNASLSEGRFALVDVPLVLEDIEIDGSIRGMTASVEGKFASGDGKGVLDAQVDWSDVLAAKVTFQAEELVISSPPLLSAKVSPHLQIVTRPTQKYVDIKGVVSVPTATIRPPEASSDVVSESPDVTVIDRRMTANVANLLAKVEPWSINADIGLDLGKDVKFQGFGAKLPLAGALHLTQSGQGRLNGRGVIQVSQRTKVDAIGQNLDLNYAQVRFNGDVRYPRLSIEAVREIESNIVGVRVTGMATDPMIKVFNDAGLSEQQAMNALVTGSISDSGGTQISEQGFRTQVTNNLAAAGLSLGLRGTRGITNQLGRALGLESLVVDASGGGGDTNVNVTGYISPDLYIRYGVGVFNAESTLSMRYQLTKRIYVEATSATENFVDMVYRWRF